jgi:type IV pilus assembly protein PilM
MEPMSSILDKISGGSRSAGRPPTAVEVAPEGVLAAAVPAAGPPVFAYAALRPGALVPGIEEPNLRSPDAVAAAIRVALDQVGSRSRAVTLVLPDTVVRVFVLDFDTLPAKQAEAIPVLRFRLRKTVPFDVERAGLNYQILSRTETEVRVLAAVVPGPVLAEYEDAVRAAGYEAGAVLPATLAALETMDTMEAAMAAQLNGHTLTTTITAGEDLLLYRTLDLPENAAQRVAEIQRGIAVAAAYFEDRLHARPQKLYYAGYARRDQFARWLDDPEMEVVDLVPRPESGLATSLGEFSIAGVAGALALHVQAVVP